MFDRSSVRGIVVRRRLAEVRADTERRHGKPGYCRPEVIGGGRQRESVPIPRRAGLARARGLFTARRRNGVERSRGPAGHRCLRATRAREPAQGASTRGKTVPPLVFAFGGM